MTDYEQKKRDLVAQLRTHDGSVRLNKRTSNLFRDRAPGPIHRLDVSGFDGVIGLDIHHRWVEAEGMTTYKHLVEATLADGVMPSVVPQLQSITAGGAVSGVGIESTSFRQGLVHEGILAMDVLTGDGEIVTCTPDNENRDLFFGLPNSYGTLGYVTKLKIRTIPVKRYVQLQHIRHRDTRDYFRALEQWSRREIDFLDGTAFAPDELYLTVGTFTDQAPYTSDYRYEHIYYRSIQSKQADYLSTHDYLWRWDTDWFWCSKNVFAQHPLIRRIYGRSRLNSVFYTKVMRWNTRWGLTRAVNRVLGNYIESVIQDVDIPIDRAAEFLEFFDREIGIRPVWICPFRSIGSQQRFPLYPTDPETLYVNFGFWDVVRSRTRRPPGHLNRKVEKKVTELGGIKSLYSDSYYTREEFWSLYDKSVYDELKQRWDSRDRLYGLYEKCVLRQ